MSFTTSTSVICRYLYDWGMRLSFTYSSEKRQNLCLLQGDSEFCPQTLSRYGASLPADLSYTSISTYRNASSLWAYNERTCLPVAASIWSLICFPHLWKRVPVIVLEERGHESWQHRSNHHCKHQMLLLAKWTLVLTSMGKVIVLLLQANKDSSNQCLPHPPMILANLFSWASFIL